MSESSDAPAVSTLSAPIVSCMSVDTYRLSSADALQESVMPDRETILRSITLAAVLVNQLIAASGRTPLPYTEEEFYQGLSAVVTVVVSLWSWWKNNSFTAKAIRADHARRK